MFRRLEQRWERRRRGAAAVVIRITVSESASVLGRSASEVWAFVRPAESAVLTEEDVVRAFTVPGTGPGVGEQQCFIRSVGDREEVHIMTIVALEEGKYAETVNNGVPLL